MNYFSIGYLSLSKLFGRGLSGSWSACDSELWKKKNIYVSKEVNKCIFKWKINQWKIQFQLTLKLVSAVHQQQVRISKYWFYFYNLILYHKYYKTWTRYIVDTKKERKRKRDRKTGIDRDSENAKESERER